MEETCPFCKKNFGISYVGTNNCNNCNLTIGNDSILLREDNEIYSISHIGNKYLLSYNPIFYKDNDTKVYFDDNEEINIFKYHSKSEYLNHLKKIMVFS